MEFHQANDVLELRKISKRWRLEEREPGWMKRKGAVRGFIPV